MSALRGIDERMKMVITTQYCDLEAFGSFAVIRALFIFVEVVAVALVVFGFLYPVGTSLTCQRRQRKGSCSCFELYANISLMYLAWVSGVLKRFRTVSSM